VIPPIVDAAWLREHRDAVVVADVRWYLDDRDGRAAYEAGHVPGAVFVDLDADLAAPGSPAEGRHPLPDPADFAAAMGRLGIGDDDAVVAYDDQGGVMAARLVWMLRAIGRDAALLDGGIDAYDGPLDTEPSEPDPKRFTATPWPADRVASIEDAADASANVVLDARQRERYLGEPSPLDPRAGHIPGARSLPARESVDEAGRFLPVDELRQRLVAVGIDRPDTPVVSACGSGVTACHNLIVMEHAGVGRGRLYPGSWSQWANDPDRPVETGEDLPSHRLGSKNDPN
jgi:thiosulfate/3-mercaptopyruvate sulfurtransferase